MAFLDALQDTVTIETPSLATDGIGQESKSFSALYTSIPCRLQAVSGFQNMQQEEGEFEGVQERWLILVEPQFNGAGKGDRATIDGTIYIITKKHEIRGTTSAIHHVIYFLQEKE